MPNRDIEMTVHGYDQSVHWNGFLAIFRLKKNTTNSKDPCEIQGVTKRIPVKAAIEPLYFTINVATQ